jgi:ubiquinone/menaquinone biosynthesis C-methylase UbiE
MRTGTLLRWDGKEWSEFNDSADRHISERLAELADMQSGSWVLDVAAGYGEPALAAARKAGPGGRVVATDISAEMLAFGRERAAAAGLGNVEFVHSDASSLNFPRASFDAAVSRWGIIFEPDAEAAAARIRGFLKPGARMAISSWGEPDQVPFLQRWSDNSPPGAHTLRSPHAQTGVPTGSNRKATIARNPFAYKAYQSLS